MHTHDPVVRSLPGDLPGRVTLHASPLATVEGAATLVIGTEWPEYQALAAETVAAAMRTAVGIDPGRFLGRTLGSDRRIRYSAVGKVLEWNSR